MSATSTAGPTLLAPRYWGIWLGVGLLRLLAVLPYAIQLLLGRLLGSVLYLLMRYRRRVARVNLELCFPELGDAERKRILVRHFRSLGMALFELANTWWASDQRLNKLVSVNGLEHLEAALQRGRGVLLVGAHFTTMELGLRLLSAFQPCYMMYRKNTNPMLEHIITSGRSRHPGHMFSRDDMRTLFSALKRNQPVWFAPDQNMGRRKSIFVPFFGQSTATVPATSRFARISGSPVVPFFQHRLPGTRGYELVLLPALEDFPSGDEAKDTARVNRIIEEQIRRSPEQYLWIHRRFKTRPDKDENVYRDFNRALNHKGHKAQQSLCVRKMEVDSRRSADR